MIDFDMMIEDIVGAFFALVTIVCYIALGLLLPIWIGPHLIAKAVKAKKKKSEVDTK